MPYVALLVSEVVPVAGEPVGVPAGRLRRLGLQPAQRAAAEVAEAVHAPDPGPGDVARLQVGRRLPSKVASACALEEVGTSPRTDGRAAPATPSGSYCTMNIVDSWAPRSESTIIFTVMPL